MSTKVASKQGVEIVIKGRQVGSNCRMLERTVWKDNNGRTYVLFEKSRVDVRRLASEDVQWQGVMQR